MNSHNVNVVLSLRDLSEQTVGEITRIVGLISARDIVPIIDALDLDANPRKSKTGPVTDAIQDSIASTPTLFPFKTKGILLAASRYERLTTGRVRIMPDNLELEGILDGGHNLLAIGLFLLDKALTYKSRPNPKTARMWDDFKTLWRENRDVLSEYVREVERIEDNGPLNFLIPIELVIPRDCESEDCVERFKAELPEICSARNNNVQLQLSTKVNQKGYYDVLREYMDTINPDISKRIEWKTNDGGVVKVQDVIALCWIPLSLVSQVKTESGRTIEFGAPSKIYGAKGECLLQFEKLMSSPGVTEKAGSTETRELVNQEVRSALRVGAELPALYDYVFEMFPKLYPSAVQYGRIPAIRKLNETRRKSVAPFSGATVDTLSPDGFIAPLVYGLQALMTRRAVDRHHEIQWIVPPMDFLHDNLEAIVKHYAGILGLCGYDPQRVGRSKPNYTQAISYFKMALADIL